jgi:hypothetical protein
MLFLSDFNKTWTLQKDSRKIFKYQIAWKSVQWERICSVRTKGQTDRRKDMKKLTVTFRNFTNVSKNQTFYPETSYCREVYIYTKHKNWFSVIISMYIQTCTHTYIYIYIYIHIYTHARMHAYINTYIHKYIIIIFINCNWVITRWQWLFYIYTNMNRK